VQILNDVTFLLDQHVLQVEEATSPLRQVYFAVQAALIDPAEAERAAAMAGAMLLRLAPAVTTAEIRAALPEIAGQIENARYFDAMKRLRALFPVEDAILSHTQRPLAPKLEERHA
jgi:flagellar protein FlbT